MATDLLHLPWENSFAALGPAFSVRTTPTPLPDVRLVAWNAALAQELGLDAEPDRATFTALVNGDRPWPGTEPVAALYAGHQFGVWVPQLGDGRAILLGELVGRNHRRWDVQVKGGGRTRFSRGGDGRAVLRSTIREYLASEAMHGLGIPTTRALAILASDATVYREEIETAALLVRVAPSHVRFGSFEAFASRGQDDLVRTLADHVIDRHYHELLTLPAATRYAAWLEAICRRTAKLVAQWTVTGFTHGVLNTDNMSILGLTLDYGPYGWMESYQRDWIPNHSDHEGRYAFGQQPRIGLWNCMRLAEALHSMIAEPEALHALQVYRDSFEQEVDSQLRAKLGLVHREVQDVALVTDLLEMMHQRGADYTRTFRALSHYLSDDHSTHQAMVDIIGDQGAAEAWLIRYRERLTREPSTPEQRRAAMLRVNPKFVLRNWIAQEAIDEAKAGRFETIEALRSLFATPFDEHPEMDQYAGPAPEGTPEIAVSCSS